MAHDFNLTDLQKFPEGTTVGLYPVTNWPTPAQQQNPTGAPVGSATATAAVTGGVAAFTAVADGVYWATATSGGTHNYELVNVATRVEPDQDLLHLSVVTAKGDLIVGTASDAVTNKAVGSDGQVLTADAASGGGVKWAAAAASVPQPPSTNQVMWLQNPDGLGLSDGAAVTTWTDSSAAAHSPTQATAGLKPVYKAGIVNGKGVVRFDGVDDLLAVAFTLNRPATIFCVALWRDDLSADQSTIFDGNTVNSARFYRTNTTEMTMYGGTGLALTGFTNPYVWTLYSTYWDTSTASVGNWTRSRLTTGNAGTTNLGGITLGNYGGGGGPAHVDIAEVVVYSAALSAANKQVVEKYLIDAYQL